MRAGISITVTAGDRLLLEAIVADRNAKQKHVKRAKVILATGEGCGTNEIMRRSELSKPVVWRWQERFMQEGVAGLLRDKTRKPGKKPLPAETVQRVVDLALGAAPGEVTHWTGRMLAKAAGVSLRSVQRILEANRLAPHRIRTFKLSNDAQFAEKLKDVVGLYVDPPAHAVVLSVDEKSQIQALDRTQPGLPMKPGRAGTMTHDYKRHGTTTLFAALNVLDGDFAGVGVELGLQRHDLLAHETTHGGDDLALLFGGIEVHWQCPCLGGAAAPLMREMVSGEWPHGEFRMPTSASPATSPLTISLLTAHPS